MLLELSSLYRLKCSLIVEIVPQPARPKRRIPGLSRLLRHCVTRVTFQINYHFVRNSIIKGKFMKRGDFIPWKCDNPRIRPFEFFREIHSNYTISTYKRLSFWFKYSVSPIFYLFI